MAGGELVKNEALELAVLEYLTQRYPDAARQFRDEAILGEKRLPPTGSLMKKWLATTRLQLKVNELEKRNKEMVDKLALYEASSQLKGGDPEGLPTDTPIRTLEGHRLAVTSIKFHPTFFLLLSASDDGSIKVWDFESGRCEKSFDEHTGAINDLSFDDTGKWLASASTDLTAKIWDFTKMTCAKTLRGHDGAVSAVRFCVIDGGAEGLLTGSRDTTIRLWEVSSGFCMRTFTGHDEWVRTLDVDQGDLRRLFVSGGSDQQVILWRSDQPSPVLELTSAASAHSHVIEGVAFASPKMITHIRQEDKKKLTPAWGGIALSQQPGEEGEKARAEAGATAGGDPPVAVVFSAARDNYIVMWDAFGEKVMRKFVGHENWIKSIVCHPCGKFLMSCSDDKSIRAWDVLDGTCVSVLSSAHRSFLTAIDFCKGATILASSSTDCTVRIWDCRSKKDEEANKSSVSSSTATLRRPTVSASEAAGTTTTSAATALSKLPKPKLKTPAPSSGASTSPAATPTLLPAPPPSIPKPAPPSPSPTTPTSAGDKTPTAKTPTALKAPAKAK
eukprot:GHVN01078027.1.p1 GENE.GHVN01078027.1~~GHVN01078027.1.p1  ORF type:complete len:558 (-),score=117.07 GHVN01078027.1:325-1998(-)